MYIHTYIHNRYSDRQEIWQYFMLTFAYLTAMYICILSLSLKNHQNKLPASYTYIYIYTYICPLDTTDESNLMSLTNLI